ncbi:MAG TPA: DNA starvation/stationary phase protection protein [Pseudonocardiaceae bacterium]|jgi:starvation-inducible DNA-binding protein|nr:DNA starvation/stationary phase protection protein [Pseudonocardiaceae bacterium]
MSASPVTGPLGDQARDATGSALQATLVDLIDLSLIAKQAHWNVVGTNFRSVHMQLDELVATARQYVDDVAERASALGVAPTGMAKTVASDSGLPEYPTGWQSDRDTVERITATLGSAIERLRPRIDETEKTDLVTQDLLIAVARALEEAHWMWQAQLA